MFYHKLHLIEIDIEIPEGEPIPPDFTDKKPPKEKDGFIIIFDNDKNKWKHVKDEYLGKLCWVPADSEDENLFAGGFFHEISLADYRYRYDFVLSAKYVENEDNYYYSKGVYFLKNFNWYVQDKLSRLAESEYLLRNSDTANFLSDTAGIRLDCGQEAQKNIPILIEQLILSGEKTITYKGYKDGEFVILTLEELKKVKQEMNDYFIIFKHKRWYLKYVLVPELESSELPEDEKIKKIRSFNFANIELPENFNEILARLAK